MTSYAGNDTQSAYMTGKDHQGQVQTWVLNHDETIVGRSEQVDIPLIHTKISRRHAKILRDGDLYYTIVDLESTNGTLVNGKRVDKTPVRLEDGMEITFGGVITLRFYDPKATEKGLDIGSAKGVWIDQARGQAWADGIPVELTAHSREYNMLELLYVAKGGLVSYEMLKTALWPEDSHVSEGMYESVLKRLRAALRKSQPLKEYIEANRGYGLRLKTE